MKVIQYDRVAQRVWVFNARVHHGLVGVGLVLGGVILIIHDWNDHWWLQDGGGRPVSVDGTQPRF